MFEKVKPFLPFIGLIVLILGVGGTWSLYSTRSDGDHEYLMTLKEVKIPEMDGRLNELDKSNELRDQEICNFMKTLNNYILEDKEWKRINNERYLKDAEWKGAVKQALGNALIYSRSDDIKKVKEATEDCLKRE